MKIARVFPNRTAATPDDPLSFIDCQPPLLSLPEIDEVHVSVAFSWHIPKAETLAEAWRAVGVPVKMGGPAFNEPGGDFVPGLYMKDGYVITSRGCPNRCWFCGVPKREGYQLRELPITHGWNVLDDNILACSDDHINAVFDMLTSQPQNPVFTGGLEARILKPWHAKRLREIGTKKLYMAYDTPDDYEPLIEAGKILRAAGFTSKSHNLGCYVLIGYQGDTIDKATERLTDTMKAGFMPYAMLYRGKDGKRDETFTRFQREWLRPQIVGTKMREVWKVA